jgi:hypothetical protein
MGVIKYLPYLFGRETPGQTCLSNIPDYFTQGLDIDIVAFTPAFLLAAFFLLTRL